MIAASDIFQVRKYSGHQHGGQHHEDDQADQGLPATSAPQVGPMNEEVTSVFGHVVGVGQGVLDLQGLVVGELVGLHAHGVAPMVVTRGWCSRATLADGFFAGGDVGVLRPGDGELRAAAELDAEVEPALDDGNQDGEQDQDARRSANQSLRLADELVGPLAGVELVAEVARLAICCNPSPRASSVLGAGRP